MRIRKPAGLSTGEFIVVTVVSLFSGYYIWKPEFEKLAAKNREKLQKQQNERVMQMKYGKVSMIMFGITAVYFTILGVKKKVIPYVRLQKFHESERYAEIIYKSESK